MRARLLAALLLVLAGLWLTPGPAYACTCRPAPEPEQLERASVVFTGTVLDDRASGDTRTYTFAVERVYRGQVDKTQTVRTNALGSACGLELPGAGPYLVLGFRQDGELLAGSCDGTRPGGAPAALGAGYPPRTGAAPTGLTWTPNSGLLTLSIGAACIAFALVVARRRSAGPKG